MHNAYKIEQYWKNIKGCEEKQYAYNARWQKIVWNFIQKLCKRRGISFSKPSLRDQLDYALTK